MQRPQPSSKTDMFRAIACGEPLGPMSGGALRPHGRNRVWAAQTIEKTAVAFQRKSANVLEGREGATEAIMTYYSAEPARRA